MFALKSDQSELNKENKLIQHDTKIKNYSIFNINYSFILIINNIFHFINKLLLYLNYPNKIMLTSNN